MIFQQFVASGDGRASYLIGCERHGQASVIDPEPAVAPYLEAAAEARVRITHIFATHAYGHDSSGAHRLAQVTGAPVLLHRAAPVTFPFAELEDGEEHDLGTVRFSILCTPGHTADSLSLVVTDRTSPTAPGLVLTGDTLFRGGVGGPDADSEASKARLAAQLYESLFHRLLTLPDQVQVFPARSAADVPATALGAPAITTIGVERRRNPALQCVSRDQFVQFVMSDGRHRTRAGNQA